MKPILSLITFLLFSSIFYGSNFGMNAFQDSIQVGQDTEVPAAIQYDKDTQLAPVNFNSEKIENFRDDKAFNYITEVEQDSWWTRFKRWLSMHYQRFLEWLFGDYQANVVVAFLLQILPYIILAGIIGLMIWLFIRLNPGPSFLGEPENPEVFYNEEEKLVRSQNISELITSAIKAGDFRLAVRYYYLLLLKQLDEKGLIDYEFQKTNAEYLSEVKEESFRDPLKKVMRIYDFIWYGSFSVSEQDFALAQNYFKQIERTLEQVPNEK